MGWGRGFLVLPPNVKFEKGVGGGGGDLESGRECVLHMCVRGRKRVSEGGRVRERGGWGRERE